MLRLFVIVALCCVGSSAVVPKRTHRSRVEREAGTCGETPAEPPYPPVSSCGKHQRIRRDAKDMTLAQRKGFTDALHALKARVSPWNSSYTWYDQFVYFHQAAVQQSRLVKHGVAHQNSAFPPWHRKLLWLLEYAMCEATGLAIGLPYWDWTNPQSTAAVFQNDLMGECGVVENNYAVVKGPFRRGVWQLNIAPTPGCAFQQSPWNYIVRGCGASEASSYPVYLPNAVEVAALLKIENYDSAPWNMSALNSFRNTLEGFVPPELARQKMHNIVHDW
jgi:tyrosinase